MSQQSFADLGVSKTVVRALAARGFEKPFAVQKLVIADILAGRDVLAQSRPAAVRRWRSAFPWPT